MTAFADLSELVNRFTGGNSGNPQHPFFWKDARVGGAAAVAPVAGRWTSLWTYEGTPSHGVVPTSTGAALDNTTDGGLKQTDPSGGRELWCTGAAMSCTQAGVLMIYDRLAHDGGFSATTTSAQAVSFTPPSRYSDGKGNMMFLEIGTIIGTTATTVTCEYTDQDNNTAITSQAVAFGGTGLREVGRLIPMTLAAGDTGVRNITNVDLAASTLTAGDFAAVLAHPLMFIPTGIGSGTIRDLVSALPSIVEIETDACIAFAFFCSNTTALQIMGSMHMAER